MPFTGSHPAAVLPLLRTPLVPSALVIGSMTPDLLYYVPLSDQVHWRLSAQSHSLGGMVGLDLVLGLLALAVWVLLIAPLAVAVAPDALRDRLGPELPNRPGYFVAGTGRVVLVVASQLIGTATHILWDEFTHPGRWGARHIGWLAAQQGLLPGYRWGQYGSSVVGMAAVVWALWRWWVRTPAVAGSQRVARLSRGMSVSVWSFVLICATAGVVVGAWAALAGRLGTGSFGYYVATYCGGAGFFAALVCSVFLVPRRSAAP